MHDVRELGIGEIVGRRVAIAGDGPVFLSVDVDVLDPAFAPGTGTPEPGGMTLGDLLWASGPSPRRSRSSGRMWSRSARRPWARSTSRRSSAERVVREVMTGIALRRQS